MSNQKNRPADSDLHEEDQDTRGTGKSGMDRNSEGPRTGDKQRDQDIKNKEGGDKQNRNDGAANDPSRLDRTGDPERKNDPTRISPDTDEPGPDQTGNSGKSRTSGNTNNI